MSKRTMTAERQQRHRAGMRIKSGEWTRSVVRVGGGRGFVVEVEQCRVVITAAHCLPRLPPAHRGSYTEERTYEKLVGELGAKPSIWCECQFVDPVSDLAVLVSPDGQELWDEARAYDALADAAVPLALGSLTFARRRIVPPVGTAFYGPPVAESEVWLLSLSGQWFSAQASSYGRSLEINHAGQDIQPGMSGSPIITLNGTALGVVSTSMGGPGGHRMGSNPLLSANLPAWMVRTIDARKPPKRKRITRRTERSS
jgi:hypothetical protein